MWAKNLFFLAVCISALLAFKASVFPAAETNSQSAPRRHDNSIRAVVERVDGAFAKTWDDEKLQPASAAADLTIARRISLALAGTIPSLEEIRRFESWPQAERLERWMAERLADPRTADYMAERLARALVGVDDGPFLLFRRRRFVSWMADGWTAGEPYDRIVRHLIADSGLWTDSPATNFITVAIDSGDDKKLDADRLAARVSRAFLGVRIDCAQCHDHPFESWKQRDFQGLAAFFGGTRPGLRGIRDATADYRIENVRTGEMETIASDVPFAKELLSDDGPQRRRLAEWVTHRENGHFARATVNRAWALLFGRPLVEPIDNLSAAGPVPPALDILADDFVERGYNLQRLFAVMAATRVFRLDSKLALSDEAGTATHEATWAVFPLTRLRPEQVVGALQQSASLATIDHQSHIVVRLAREIGQREFINRYGDAGADEFEARGGTIPQRLLMMNGQIVDNKTKDSLLANAATQIAALAPDDDTAVETAMLAVLTRPCDAEEKEYFTERLARTNRGERARRLGDLYWTLVNSSEFSWNH
jgi:hypothetical protein